LREYYTRAKDGKCIEVSFSKSIVQLTLVTIVNKNISFQVNLVDAYETSKMCMLKFETLPGTDVISYLAEKSTYSEQVSIKLN
jgi:hypothetical protein